MGQVWNTLSSRRDCAYSISAHLGVEYSAADRDGPSIYSEDLLVASSDPSLVSQDEFGQRVFDSNRFLTGEPVVLARSIRLRACLEFRRLYGGTTGQAGHGAPVDRDESRVACCLHSSI